MNDLSTLHKLVGGFRKLLSLGNDWHAVVTDVQDLAVQFLRTQMRISSINPCFDTVLVKDETLSDTEFLEEVEGACLLFNLFHHLELVHDDLAVLVAFHELEQLFKLDSVVWLTVCTEKSLDQSEIGALKGLLA